MLSVLEKKAETGEEITVTPHPAHQPGKVIDLMEALKKSLENRPQTDRPALYEKSAVNVQRDQRRDLEDQPKRKPGKRDDPGRKYSDTSPSTGPITLFSVHVL